MSLLRSSVSHRAWSASSRFSSTPLWGYVSVHNVARSASSISYRNKVYEPQWQTSTLLDASPRRRLGRLRSSTHRPQWRCFSGKAVGYTGTKAVLAIETSCDDTSVAVLVVDGYVDRKAHQYNSIVQFHERITADSAQYSGIHPIVALESHQRNLASMVKRALDSIKQWPLSDYVKKPDLIAVTRGPGMRSNLAVGLEMAKGLAVAYDAHLIGVHHMQAHALTPRLCSALINDGEIIRAGSMMCATWSPSDLKPEFPYLTVLASGGHTMLLSSNSLVDHQTLAETADIALGDCLDKAARAILPSEELVAPYGKALEEFAFDCDEDDEVDYDYEPPKKRGDELERKTSRYGWSIGPPLADSKGGDKSSRRMIYSFAGVLNTVDRIMAGAAVFHRSIEERRELARETMRVVFEHLASRIFLHLQDLPSEKRDEINTIVISGGVAANGYLRHILRSMLDARGYEDIKLEFPPPEFCTDNALMIAWAGLEMFDAGFTSRRDIQPIRKWSMDQTAEDGGIVGPDRKAVNAASKKSAVNEGAKDNTVNVSRRNSETYVASKKGALSETQKAKI